MVDHAQYLDNAKANHPKYKAREEEENSLRYRDLWPINPEFRDVNRKSQVIKIGSLVTIYSFIIFYLLSFSLPIMTLVELVIFSMLLFLFSFRDRIFSLQSMLSFSKFDPFKQFVFWQIADDPYSVLYTHYADLLTIGIRIFRIEVMPENVSASIKHFVRAAANNFHTLNYQVVHIPIHNSISRNSQAKQESYRTFIYFTVTKKFTGLVNITKIRKLMESLRDESATLSSRFIADFHHYKITFLSGTDAMTALRTIFLHLPKPNNMKSETQAGSANFPIQAFVKGATILFFSIFNGWLSSMIWNNSWFSIGASLSTCIVLIFIWWKELLFGILSKRFFRSNMFEIVEPFKDLTFYRFKKAPHIIFFHSEYGFTGGIEAFNVRKIPQPLYFNKNKLYHPLVGTGTSFSTTLSAAPISFYTFSKVGYKKLSRYARNHLCYKVQSEEAREIWMVQRAGMWKAEILLTTQAYRYAKKVSSDLLHEIESELHENSQKLSSLFRIQYSGCELESLQTNRLESALLMCAVKTRNTRLGGSHLKYMLLQGLDFYPFMDIDNSFKKGIETKIAAEFNTPLHLDNEISLGHTINTEFLEQEITAGFSLEQARQLLIINGMNASREDVSLLLARNLIAEGKHVIYFDFSGNGSKLIRMLEKESLQDKIVHYSLGKTLTIDPIHSEIPHDPHNVQFLDLMLDAYALCFKRDEHTISMFKNSLSQLSTTGEDGDPVSFRTLSLVVDNQQEWKKSPAVSSILSTLEDFTEQDSAYLYSHKDAFQGKSNVLEFFKTEKSVIIDISNSKDLEKQCFFTWLILAKSLHYHSQNKDCVPKYFFIPHIDMVFDQYFLETNMKYGKISKFLTPLLQAGCGFICSASQAHLLHSSLFSIFQNYVVFKATDSRDISILKNVLNLEELHGQGYYSKSRNEAYQARYLMTMRPHEALMKRDDLYQPFPVEFTFDNVRSLSPLSWEEIISHMKSQGYDIEDSERKILERAQKTVLEKDFGQYAFIIPEIITFLEGLQTVHQVGNLYRSKIAEELKHYIHPKLTKISKDKRQLKKMREEVLSNLFSRGYLIESHPRQASGGQSIRTSYQVSPKFSTVLDDYYQAKQGISTDVQLEVIAQETGNIPDFMFSKDSIPKKLKPSLNQIRPILRRISIDVIQWNLFQMHRSLAKYDYERCLKIGKDLPEMFLSNLQAEIERLPEVERFSVRNDFISALSSIEGFSMTKEEVQQWQSYSQELNTVEHENIQELCQKLYESHKQFSFQLESIISGGEMLSDI